MNHYPKTTGLTQSAIGNIEAGIRGYGASVVVIAHALKTDPGFLQMIDRGVRSITTPNTTALVGGSAGVSLDAAIAVLADAIERSPYRGQENLLGMLAYMGKSPGDEINRQAIAALLQNKQQPDARPQVAA